ARDSIPAARARCRGRLRSWLPALVALRRGLSDLREERAVTLRVPEADDEPRQLLDAFNLTAAAVLRRSATLLTLAEIDALMVASSELEEVMDAVLARVREVTRCRAAGIALIDANAGLHARLFVASHEGGPLPVTRVSLDPSLLETLEDSPEGLTIARCEDERHSCLQPLVQVGAQFFWAWPVFAGEKLAAILAVGYDHPARAEASLAAYGTDCAHRLGAALSSNARAETLYHQAHFDTLTQLPNRLLFRDRLAQELAAVAVTPSRGAVLYVDLDHFKKINDSLGHDAGDQVLAITAQRLRSCVKEGDTVARLAGDEFTVILRQVSDPAAANAVAGRIVESLQLPVNIAGQDHHVRASIGITLYPDDGTEIDELLRNADLAMYRAKALGRGTAVFFDRKMIGHDTRAVDSGLHRALKRREFSLFYQPQYSLDDGRLLGMEALLRWN
ncbi:diguanylate cyclase, partial [bacterium]